MRIEHGCIFILLMMIGTSLFWGMRQSMLQRLAYTRYCYNQLADNAIEDGLDAGCRLQGGQYPVIDEKMAQDTFIDSLCKSFDVPVDSIQGHRINNCVKGIVFLQKEFFTVRTGDESCQYRYEARIQGWQLACSLDGQMEAWHQLTGEHVFGTEEEVRRRMHLWEGYEEGMNLLIQRIVVESVEPKLSEMVRNCAGKESYKVDIPVVRETNSHTLMGVSMLCLIQFDSYRIDGCTMDRYALSGARVVKNQRTGSGQSDKN